MDSMSRTLTWDADGAARSPRGRGRDSLFLTARLVLPGARDPIDARVRNLSAGGLMLEVERPVEDGVGVTLTMRGVGEVTGKVAWCAEGRIGIAFDRPIDPKLARKPVGKGPGTPEYAKPQLR